MNNETAFDTAKSETFADNMLGVLNNAALAIMCSIGHRTKLFDTMDKHHDTTSEQLAEKSGLNERYVREWLGAMTAGKIVDHDPDTGTYRLPEEHAAYLTRAVGADNMAQFTQWVAVLGYVEDEVVDAFTHGKGVPYEAYRRFHEVMAQESELTVVAGLVDHILPLEPGLPEQLERGIKVLDVGCGKGKAMLLLAQKYPNSTFTGYDFLEEPIEAGRAEAEKLSLSNISFVQRDAATFEDTDSFDLVCTFDSVHDQARPDALLRNIHRALKPAGTYLMQDIQGTSSHHGDKDHPIAPFIYTISTMHCMSVSLAHGGPGLGAAWGSETALKMLKEAGFNDTRVEELPHDFQNYYYISHK